MTIKPFAIQGADLTLGGVNLQAGTTGVVIPGVTQATNYTVDEVNDTDDQTHSFTTVPTVIDPLKFAILNGDVSATNNTPATYQVEELDDDGYIDGIDVTSPGSFVDRIWVDDPGYMYATEVANAIANFDPNDWTQIPFLPRVRAGEVENVGGGTGGSLTVVAGNGSGGTTTVENVNEILFSGLVTDLNDGTIGITTNALWSGELKLELGENGHLTFPDGSVQTTAYTGQSGGGGTNAISKFVTISDGSNVWGSDDGVFWTGPFDTGIADLNKVAVGPDMIVYIGNNAPVPFNSLYYATAWNVTPTQINDTAPPEWVQVRYFADIGSFVAVGTLDGTPAYKHSTDGINWTQVLLDDSWATTLAGGAGYGGASFEDIAYNGAGFLLITSNTTLGSFYTTTLTSNTLVTSSMWLDDGMNFNQVVYSAQAEFTGWFAFGNGNTGVGDDGWWYNSSFVPGNGSFINNWAITDVGQEFADVVNYQPDWSELAIGRYNNIDTIVFGSNDGQVLYWPAVSDGPFVSIPKPYTNTQFSITSANPAVISWNGGSDSRTGEKIVITNAGDFNGTFYVDELGILYTDTLMESGLDSGAFAAYTTGGTVTFSHGQYIDALDFVDGKVYVGNDNEEVFISADGGATWVEVASLGDRAGEIDGFLNDIDGYVSEGTTTVSALTNGDQTFTLNADGSITFPDGSVQTTAYTGTTSTTFEAPLPDWLEVVADTEHFPVLNTDYGFDNQGVWTVNATIGNANNEGTSYPFRTAFTIPTNTKSVTTVTFVVATPSFDFGIGVFDGDTTSPVWAWDGSDGNSSANRIGAQYSGTSSAELHGISGGAWSDAFSMTTPGTYTARLTIENVDPNEYEITLETIDDSDTVINTISYIETSFFQNGYKIGFASDEDSGTPRVYFKYLTINLDNGATVYTDELTSYSSALLGQATNTDPYVWVDKLSYVSELPISPWNVSGTAYDNDGNLYALVNNYADGDPTFTTLMKFSPLGSILAQVEYANDFNIDGWGLAVSGNGVVYISGATIPDGNYDMFVSRLDSSLVEEWTQTYGALGGDDEYGYVIDVDSNNYPIIVGSTESNNGDIVVMKLNPNDGAVVWQRKIVGAGYQQAYGMGIGPDNEVVVVGYDEALQSQVVLKYDYNGYLVWQKTIKIDAGFDCNGADAEIDINGNIYVLGTYDWEDGSLSGSGMCITKLSSAGVASWTRKVQGPCNSTSANIVMSGDYLYISAITGTEVSGSPAQKLVQVVAKYDTDGVVKWQRYFKHSSDWLIDQRWWSNFGGSNLSVFEDRFAIGSSLAGAGIDSQLNWHGVLFQGSTAGTVDALGDFSFTTSTLSGSLTTPFAVNDSDYSSTPLFMVAEDYTAGTSAGNIRVNKYESTTVVANKLTNGDYKVTLDEDGHLHIPGNIVVGVGPNSGSGDTGHLVIDATDYNTSIKWKNFNSPQDPGNGPFECQAQLLRVFADENINPNPDKPHRELVALTVIRPDEAVDKNGLMISTSIDKIPDGQYNDNKGTRNNWIFSGDGKLIFPNDSEQTAAYDLDRQLSKTVNFNQNSVDVRADLTFVSENFGLIGTYLNDYNFDTYFSAATAGWDGCLYAIGVSRQFNPYGDQRFIVAWNSDGTLKWSKRFADETNIEQNPWFTNIQQDNNGNIALGWNSTDNDRVGITRISYETGAILNTKYVNTSNNDTIRQFDIHATNAGGLYIGGQVSGEVEQYNSVLARSGSFVGTLAVALGDINNPAYVGSYNYNNWSVDLSGEGDWYTPTQMNTFYTVPVTTLTGGGENATMNIGYVYDANSTTDNWRWDNSTSVYTGEYHNDGDIVAIKGSAVGGTDSTVIAVPNEDYVRTSDGNNTVWTFITADFANMDQLTTETLQNFEMWGLWNNDQYNQWRLAFRDEPWLWTVGTNGLYTVLTYTGNPAFLIGGAIVFADTANGNDMIGFWNGGSLNSYNYRGAPTGKIRLTMSQGTDFRGPQNLTTFTSVGGADYNLGDFKYLDDTAGTGNFWIQVVTPRTAITNTIHVNSYIVPNESGFTLTVTSELIQIGSTGNYGFIVTGDTGSIANNTEFVSFTANNNTYNDAFWNVRQLLDQQAYVGKLDNWWVSLGKSDNQTTQAITVDENYGRVYALINLGVGNHNVLLIALDDNNGDLLWSKYAENTDSLGGQPGSVVADGGNGTVFVVSEDDNGHAILTKYAGDSGVIMWQIKHEQSGGWDNRPVAALASDGNIIVSGAFYDEDYENDDVVPFWKINAETGAVMFKTMLVDRNNDRSFREYYDEDCQQFSIVGNYMSWAGYISDDENEYDIGVAVKLPTDGTGFGLYGRWEYQELVDSYDWVVNTTKADDTSPNVELSNNIVFNVSDGNVVYWDPEDMTDPTQGYDSAPYSRVVGALPGKIRFTDESEIVHPGIARHSVDTGDNGTWLQPTMNGKFMYYFNDTNSFDSTIYIPTNADTPLPIGYTVTVVVGAFNGHSVYVNNNNNSDVQILANGIDNWNNGGWGFAGDGIPGVYTIMKIDTNTWMLAGPNVWAD